jgi:hypothetical protein
MSSKIGLICIVKIQHATSIFKWEENQKTGSIIENKVETSQLNHRPVNPEKFKSAFILLQNLCWTPQPSFPVLPQLA